ncbi:MAG: TAXI family TRAP transporter solute-binding subunit [Burkholderiaceae bacterium]|nr:TAXI family TRAP transporter solute-binding subunit [Burkholderiaceae bacterium]
MNSITLARNAARALAKTVLAISTVLGSGVAVAQTATQIATGGVTGTNYMIAAPLANYINENSKILRVSPSTSGGAYENLRRVDSAQAQFGMTQPDAMTKAWNGEKPFDKPMRNWRVIGVATPQMAIHVIALHKNEIRTVSDLKGKTFAIGAPGSGSATGTSLFLDYVGMKNDVNIRMESHQDYPSQLLDGKLQAFARLGSVPAAVVDEVAASQPVNLVDFSLALENSKFLEKYPFYQKVVVKAGTYKGQDRDITMFGNASYLIVGKDVPNELVYDFTRLAYSDGAIKKVEMAFKGSNLNRSNPLEGSMGPVHPGAAKFWNELGVKIPDAKLK